jgi:hypothetical protein
MILETLGLEKERSDGSLCSEHQQFPLCKISVVRKAVLFKSGSTTDEEFLNGLIHFSKLITGLTDQI